MRAAVVIFAFVFVVATVRDVSGSVKLRKLGALDNDDMEIVREAWSEAQSQLNLPNIDNCKLYYIVKFEYVLSTRYVVQYDFPDAYNGYYDHYSLFSFTYKLGSSYDYALRQVQLDDGTRVSR